jgi:hypothetical protein
MTTYITPVVSTALGMLLLDERVMPVVLLTMALILAGVWLLNRRAAMRSSVRAVLPECRREAFRVSQPRVSCTCSNCRSMFTQGTVRQ